MIRVSDLRMFLLDAGSGWVNREDTVDRITHGDGDHEVIKVGVTWMGTVRAARRAADLGCDLLVVHEPIIWAHRDDMKNTPHEGDARAKLNLLDELGLTVLRCHDLWDRYPEIGVGQSWAKYLGFDNLTSHEYQSNTDGGRGTPYFIAHLDPPPTLHEVAQQIARATQPLGQQAIATVGPPDLPISRLILNIGAWGGMANGMSDARDRHGAQAAEVTELVWWRDSAWALDNNFGLLHVNHGVSECYSMQVLSEYLAKEFSELEFVFVTEASPYAMIGPDGPLPGQSGTDLFH